MQHLSRPELDAGLDHIRAAPKDDGLLKLIVQRPSSGERVVIVEGALNKASGLVGDNWLSRGSRMTDDGSAHPDMQLNLMNIRVAQLVAQSADRIPLAGDQLYIDFDITEENTPPGTRLKIGEAEIEITAVPHLGCSKFVERFGRDAMEFVNSDTGKLFRLRGVNAKVVKEGKIKLDDTICKLE